MEEVTHPQAHALCRVKGQEQGGSEGSLDVVEITATEPQIVSGYPLSNHIREQIM